MSVKGGKYFVSLEFFSFYFLWLRFWLFLWEKLGVTYLQPWVGTPLCQCCMNTIHTMLFCPMEWNVFHLHVKAPAPHVSKTSTCQGCGWKALISTGLLGGWATLETLFFICFSVGSFSVVLGPFSSSIVQDNYGVENRLCDALVCKWGASNEEMWGRSQLWVSFQWMRLHRPEAENKKGFLLPTA